MISTNQLIAIMPGAGTRVGAFWGPLNDAMAEFSITSPARQAAFLAQCAHESGELQFTRELASGAAYEPPSPLAQELGNTQPGDGPRFKGRGLLQATGRAIYARLGAALGLDLIAHPELLELPAGACRSAGWIWSIDKNLNGLADADQFGAITKRINGGYNGLDSRLKHWLAARRALGIGG